MDIFEEFLEKYIEVQKKSIYNGQKVIVFYDYKLTDIKSHLKGCNDVVVNEIGHRKYEIFLARYFKKKEGINNGKI